MRRPAPIPSESSLPHRYTRTAITLHWLIAVLMLGNIAGIYAVGLLPSAAERPVIDLHKSVGLLVLGLVLLRILWRVSHVPPPLPPGIPRRDRRLAAAVHLGLYGLMLAIPLSGWLHDSYWRGAATHPLHVFGLPFFRLPVAAGLDPAAQDAIHARWFAVHWWLAMALLALFALHLAGALKHSLWDGESELARMLPGRRLRPPA